MVGGIFYEHLHRLVASTVGFLIVVLAIWLGARSRGDGCGGSATWRLPP